MADEFLIASRVSKRFGITQALDDVSVSFRSGEVHALMGENGAGKSTLGKLIAGLHKPDAGEISLAGRRLVPGSIHDAFAAGVRIVHQELAQCPNLSVAENLSVHAIPTRLGCVDFRAMRARAARLVHRLDPGIDVDAPLGLLAPGRRQIVQIASCLDDPADAGMSRAKVIVFDEPTSSLSVSEADRLLEIIRRLASEGLTILYVSHRMGEIFSVCDRVTVLRDGKFVATSDVKSIGEPALVEQMIGRRLDPSIRGEAGAFRALAGDGEHHAGKVRLEVRGLTSPGRLRGISLRVRAGEVVGVGGLVGSGRSELLNAIFGLDPAARGEIVVDGAVLPHGPTPAIRAGVGYVPEDRRVQGLFFLLGIGENIIIPRMPEFSLAAGWRGIGKERAEVDSKVREFQIKAASHAHTPGTLSGGNQQKLLLARWMGRGTGVLLLDEPTRGIDVGTKTEVHRLVRAAADQGTAVLLVSSEMPELLALSDRVLVMSGGLLTGELSGEGLTQANILRLATSEAIAR
jgi:ABC-type sugar transport system ATPase subunit